MLEKLKQKLQKSNPLGVQNIFPVGDNINIQDFIWNQRKKDEYIHL